MKLEDRVQAIERRNSSVQADKAWETSLVRKVAIMVCTYLFMGLFLSIINAPNPWINGLVPVCGFFLSTLTLPLVKRWWIKKFF